MQCENNSDLCVSPLFYYHKKIVKRVPTPRTRRPSQVPAIIMRPVNTKHYALYIGSGLVIHYYPDQGSTNAREMKKYGATTRVRVDTVERFLGNKDQYFEIQLLQPFDAAQALALALLNRGRREWNLVFENCQHFILFCVLHKQKDTRESRWASKVRGVWAFAVRSKNGRNFLEFCESENNFTRDQFYNVAQSILNIGRVSSLPETTRRDIVQQLIATLPQLFLP